MIIVRVPFRVSLFGGGTDFAHFYEKNTATIVSFSIDKYCYISLRKLLPYFGYKYRISWSMIEERQTIDEISHPSVKACLRYMNISDGLEIQTMGDLPARSGLGSSSAFTAALLTALYEYTGNSYTKQSIAKSTIVVEQEELKECVGIQDQIQVCHGGFNVTRISSDSNYSLLSMDKTNRIVEEINDSLILVYSGIARFSSNIQSRRKESKKKTNDEALRSINEYAETFAQSLVSYSATFDDFCNLLNKSWNAKLSTMQNDSEYLKIVEIYEKAMRAGAKSGKLLGAGGGGFFAFFVKPNKQTQFIDEMKPYLCVNAYISFDGVSRIL